MAANETDLLPCPFCGAPAMKWAERELVECSDTLNCKNTSIMPVTEWNRRAPSRGPTASVIDKLLATEPMPDLPLTLRSIADRITVAVNNPTSHGGSQGVRDFMKCEAGRLRVAADRVAALANAAPPRPSEGWQPIETAPKDGETTFLAWTSNGEQSWMEMAFRPVDCPDDAAVDLMGTATYPTYWMPLPAPPADEAGQESANG